MPAWPCWSCRSGAASLCPPRPAGRGDLAPLVVPTWRIGRDAHLAPLVVPTRPGLSTPTRPCWSCRSGAASLCPPRPAGRGDPARPLDAPARPLDALAGQSALLTVATL